MSKRRRGNRHTHYQVPSLRELARHAVDVASGRPVARHWRTNMDTVMSSSTSTGTQTSSRGGRSAAADGVKEAGQGLRPTIPKSIPHGWDNTYTVRLTYADNFKHDIAQNGSASAFQAFRVDSIFDPDATGTGHQPILRDLWASQYDFYTVLACDYKIRLYNANADPVTYTAVGTSAQRIGCINATLLRTLTAGDFGAAANGYLYPSGEMKNAITSFLPPGESMEWSGTLTPGDLIVEAKDADSDAIWTAVGSNPTITRYVGYILSPAQWATLVGVSETPYSTIQVQVILDYTVQFTQMNASLRTVSS